MLYTTKTNDIPSVMHEFDWDQWNIQKNESKHGGSQCEAESAVYDPAYRLFFDFKHSSGAEKRSIIFGKSLEARVLTIAFALRGNRVRIISARLSSRKEKCVYKKK